MTRRLERVEKPTYIRLEMDPAKMGPVEDAAHACRLSLASFCRLAIEMLSANGKATIDDIRREADRRLSQAEQPKGKGK
ncbi:MAG TPA: hypothetical protein VM597_14650 [Gemmataceae bacterium]|nr:hypothetical protein [Gemmataceae bacterium]